MRTKWLVAQLNCILFFIPNLFQTIKEDGYPEFVKIVEVGPRDGLQNEKVYLFHSSQKLIYSTCVPLFCTTIYYYPWKAPFSASFIHKTMHNIWVYHNCHEQMFHIFFEIE